MILYFLLIVSLLCVASDFCLWRHYFYGHRDCRWAHIGFGLQALLLDVALPVAALCLGRLYVDDNQAVQPMLWLMWLLVLNIISKSVFAVFIGLGDLLNRLVRRKWRGLEITGMAVTGLFVLMMLYGALSGVSRLRVNRVVITSPKIPAAFDGYRVAQFSDLHLGNIPKNSTLIARLVDSIQSLKPDLIIQSGDLVNLHADELTPEVLRQLARLRAPDGVVAVLGNHDLGGYINDSVAGLRSLSRLEGTESDLGWKLLQNEHIWIHRGMDSLAVAGVGYPLSGSHGSPAWTGVTSDLRKAMHGIDTTSFSLLVAHTPSIWDSIPAIAAPDLTISGHIHTMQMKFTLRRWRFSPAQWFYRHWSGLYVRAGRRLYVNDGIGYVLYPMRIGAPGEITLYELKSARKP